MKLLLENWRQYLNERIDSWPAPKDEPWDIGEVFPTITKLDIVEKPFQNVHFKNTLLDFFVKLQNATDEKEIKSILKAMYSFSGNADDFNYGSKKSAIEDYLDPYRYDRKSLRDYHRKIKKIVRNR